MSGGRATVRLARGDSSPHISGDICSVHPEGNVFISDFFPECKDYRDLAIAQFALEQSGLLVDFWLTAVEEAGKHEKLPMLIFHQARRPICVALSSGGVQYLNTDKHVFLVAPALDMHIMHFDKFTTLAYPRVRG